MVSKVVKCESASLRLATSQTCTSPRRAGIAAGDREEFTIGRKADTLNPLAQSDQPRHQSRAIGLVKQHFVKTGHREQCAVGRIVQ